MVKPAAPADFYRAENYTAEASVGYLMRRVLLSLTQHTGRRLEPVGLTHAQWAPLFKLKMGSASTVAELARAGVPHRLLAGPYTVSASAAGLSGAGAPGTTPGGMLAICEA